MFRLKRIDAILIHRSVALVLRTNSTGLTNNPTIRPASYDFELGKQLDKKWVPKLEKIQELYSQNAEEQKPKKYILSMFPYPSGKLHLGHVRVYTTGDIFARYYRMKGFNVIHPIGWDSFGLPAENAAKQRKIRPDVWTKNNIEMMKEQLKSLSFSFDWNRELATSHESYYKWTQHLFLEFYKNGLAYQKEALVNWDPIDETVLADEQIDSDGRSWRSGAKVEKKILKQWFIKSSFFAKSLSDSLDTLASEDWEIVKKIQKMWIGDCSGCFIDFKVEINGKQSDDFKLSVYSNEPYGVYGASHVIISRHNLILKRLKSFKENTFLSDCKLINPLTGEKLPVYLFSNYDYGEKSADNRPFLDAKLSIPSMDENSKDFAIQNGLKFTEIFDKNGRLVNCGEQISGKSKQEAFVGVCELLRSAKSGGYLTSFKLNDWCISRQRKWGAPIPIVYSEDGKPVPVAVEDLPVKLNTDAFFDSQTPNSGLRADDLTNRKEKDTMDTFVDSSWYFLRYLDVNNTTEPYDLKKLNKYMPVDIYVGGIEHAMTHLFVSRLVTHFLHHQGKIEFKEPFKRFLAMGMIKGETFKTRNGEYVASDLVEARGDKYFSGDVEVFKDFEKMSKSKLNGVDPEFMINKYGIDFTRLFLVNFVHPKSDRNFSLSSDLVDGNKKIFERIWKLVLKAEKWNSTKDTRIQESTDLKQIDLNKAIYKVRNKQLSMIAYNLNSNFNFPSYIVAVSKMIKFLISVPEASYSQNYVKLLAEMLIVLSPVIPHFSCECWEILRPVLDKRDEFCIDRSILEQSWPQIDRNWEIEIKLKVKEVSQVFRKMVPKHEIEQFSKEDALHLFAETQSKYLGDLNQYSVDLDTSSMPLHMTLNLKKNKDKAV